MRQIIGQTESQTRATTGLISGHAVVRGLGLMSSLTVVTEDLSVAVVHRVPG